MSASQLGRLQLQILGTMGRHPLGGWPTKWRLNYRDTNIMLQLERRGLVRPQHQNPSIAWVLTDLGRQALDQRPKPKPVTMKT